MNINHTMDELVKKRQGNCDHSYQYIVTNPQGVFCGICGKEKK